MADSIKVTKKMVLEALRNVVENVDLDFGDVVTSEDVLGYIDTSIEQINTKAEKAKARAEKNKADGDALREVVKDALTDEPQTADAITAAVQAVEGNEEVTKGKVVARLTQLINSGVAHKEPAKVDDRKVMVYALGAAPAEVEE